MTKKMPHTDVHNDIEKGCLAALWSEHCAYPSSKIYLETLPRAGKHVCVGMGGNAGALDIGNGYAIVFKVESHNHPSYHNPVQGAATGVGGIVRDVLAMGARPVALGHCLRFGMPDHPKTDFLLRGVVKGLSQYGNCIGVPTLYSDVDMHPAFSGNILVNAMALGVVKIDQIKQARLPKPIQHVVSAQENPDTDSADPLLGAPVVYIGMPTGFDGVHGATMASAVFQEETTEQAASAVQRGNPFFGKLLIEVCCQLVEEDLVWVLQDMGAAGLTVASAEMLASSAIDDHPSAYRYGMHIDLDTVPTVPIQGGRMMDAYSILLSETQERMLCIPKAGAWTRIEEICQKWQLPCAIIGHIDDSATWKTIKKIKTEEENIEEKIVTCTHLPVELIHDHAPRYTEQERPCTRYWQNVREDQKFAKSANATDEKNAKIWGSLLGNVEESPIQRRENSARADALWIYEQFDRFVRTSTFLDGSQAPAALFWVREAEAAIAFSLVAKSRIAAIHPVLGARISVAEGVLRAACVGATAIGVTDGLNCGDPQDPWVMGQLVGNIQGIKEFCEEACIPVVSGNVSLYNTTKNQKSFSSYTHKDNDTGINTNINTSTYTSREVCHVLPTPVIGVVGVRHASLDKIPQWGKRYAQTAAITVNDPTWNGTSVLRLASFIADVVCTEGEIYADVPPVVVMDAIAQKSYPTILLSASSSVMARLPLLAEAHGFSWNLAVPV